MLAMDKVVGLPITQESHTSSCVGISNGVLVLEMRQNSQDFSRGLVRSYSR